MDQNQVLTLGFRDFWFNFSQLAGIFQRYLYFFFKNKLLSLFANFFSWQNFKPVKKSG